MSTALYRTSKTTTMSWFPPPAPAALGEYLKDPKSALSTDVHKGFGGDSLNTSMDKAFAEKKLKNKFI